MNASSPYSAQPGNITALENQSIVHPDIGALRSSSCLRQLFKGYPVNPRTDGVTAGCSETIFIEVAGLG